MRRYNKIPLQRIADNYLGRILNLPILLLKRGKNNLLKKPKKATIFRLSSIGDSILLLPAIKNFKEKTKAKIVVVCSKENLQVFEGQGFIDKIIILDNKTINPFKIISTLIKIKKENADISIDTTHSSNMSAFFSYFGGKFHIGFSNPETSIRNNAYDKKISLDPKKHMVFNYYDLFNLAGIKYNKKRVKLVRPSYSKEEEKEIERKLGNKKKLIGVHIISELPYKKWPGENFVGLINYILTKKYAPVLIGSASEKKITDNLLKKLDGKKVKRVINLSGDTNIKELIALMERLSLFIGIDGGPMHIASSMNIPTLGLFSQAPKDPILGLFGSEDRFRYYPFNKKSNFLYTDKMGGLEFSEVKMALEKML